MLTSPRPLEEKMTLFWHGHFATEELKNDDYRLMLQQNMTLRQLASSDMSSLLIAMSKDPAMLLYLDNRLNVKATPMKTTPENPGIILIGYWQLHRE